MSVKSTLAAATEFFAMGYLKNSLRFLIVAVAIVSLGHVQARAETPLIEVLNSNPQWVGTVDERGPLAVTFLVADDPPKLSNVFYRWQQERLRVVVEFKLEKADIEFMIPPKKRNRRYSLTLTEGGALRGSLTGFTRDKKATFSEDVLLEPVAAAEARAPTEARVLDTHEIQGSAKHCRLPSDFAVSEGGGLPQKLKRYLGYFSGFWETDRLYHTLLVSEITEDGSAIVYYAHEKYKPWKINKPECSRYQAEIEDGLLKLTTGRRRAIVTYGFLDFGTLMATYEFRGRVTAGMFKRHN